MLVSSGFLQRLLVFTSGNDYLNMFIEKQLYLRSGKDVSLRLELPAGQYEGEWLDAVSGRKTALAKLGHVGGVMLLKPPEFGQDGALRLIVKGNGAGRD